MMKGYKFVVPGRMGTMKFVMTTRNFASMVTPDGNINKKFIDWKRSLENRKEIIERGGHPKNPKYPDGEEWKVPYDEMQYPFCYWSRFSCSAKNKTAYTFTPAMEKIRWLYKKLHEDKLLAITLNKNKP